MRHAAIALLLAAALPAHAEVTAGHTVADYFGERLMDEGIDAVETGERVIPVVEACERAAGGDAMTASLCAVNAFFESRMEAPVCDRRDAVRRKLCDVDADGVQRAEGPWQLHAEVVDAFGASCGAADAVTDADRARWPGGRVRAPNGALQDGPAVWHAASRDYGTGACLFVASLRSRAAEAVAFARRYGMPSPTGDALLVRALASHMVGHRRAGGLKSGRRVAIARRLAP